MPIRTATTTVSPRPPSFKTLSSVIERAGGASDKTLKAMDRNHDGRLTEKELAPLLKALEKQQRLEPASDDLKSLRAGLTEKDRSMMVIAQAAISLGNAESYAVKDLSKAVRAQLTDMAKQVQTEPQGIDGAIGKMTAMLLLPTEVLEAAVGKKLAPDTTTTGPQSDKSEKSGWKANGAASRAKEIQAALSNTQGHAAFAKALEKQVGFMVWDPTDRPGPMQWTLKHPEVGDHTIFATVKGDQLLLEDEMNGREGRARIADATPAGLAKAAATAAKNLKNAPVP